MKKHVKCTLVGDGACGKTEILVAFTTKSLPEAAVTNVFGNYSIQLKVEGQDVELHFFFF